MFVPLYVADKRKRVESLWVSLSAAFASYADARWAVSFGAYYKPHVSNRHI